MLNILVKVVGDHRRRYRRKDAHCVPHTADSEGDLTIASPLPEPSAELEQQEAVRLLHALLEELDESKREVLVLAQLEEMTVPEIAEMLGANVNTIYARLRDGAMPAPVKLGGSRAVGWIESEIDAFLHAVVERSRKGS